jgi:hypothetical protein
MSTDSSTRTDEKHRFTKTYSGLPIKVSSTGPTASPEVSQRWTTGRAWGGMIELAGDIAGRAACRYTCADDGNVVRSIKLPISRVQGWLRNVEVGIAHV